MRRGGGPPGRAVRGVILDIGNVLIQLRPIEEILAGPAPVDAARPRPDAGLDPLRLLREDPVLDRLERGRATEPEFFDCIRRLFGGHLRDEEIQAGYERILGEPVPGMEALVRDLRERGLRVVGLTDISPGHLSLIGRYPAVRALEAIVASCSTACRKPEPGAFLAALAEAGTPPGETLFVDDQPANVEGARAVGLRGMVFSGAQAIREYLGI